MRRGWYMLVATVLLATGCSTLPSSGKVHTLPDSGAGAVGPAPYFAPPGPTRGDDKAGVVRGFLLAMQANPPSTAVARQFLSAQARANWRPIQGTLVYDVSSVIGSADHVTARFSDAHRLSPSGAWEQGSGDTISREFRLVREGGQWRIDNPPNELAVPASYFPSLFVPFTLYFYDRTGTVLVPRRVYVPRGEQTATSLVRGLLAGPGPALGEVATSAFPPRTTLDLAVVVNDSGVAEVPLGPRALRLSAAELARMVPQLARTLRQVPGIDRIRITIDGSPVTLAEGQTEAGVGTGATLDPTAGASHDVVGIVGGRVVRDGGTPAPIGGPLGATGFALRSVALSAERHRVAAVAANGRTLYLAADRGSRKPGAVRTPVTGAQLLRPTFDRFGRLWVVDRTARGAVVHVVSGGGQDRVVRIPGVSGRDVSAFTVTREGARFIATLASGSTPTVLVSDVVRSPAGGVVRLTRAATVRVPGPALGPALDVAQTSATTVSVLVQRAKGSGRVLTVELDGSPGTPGAGPAEVVPGVLTGLVASPDPNDVVGVITRDRGLLVLDDAGQWTSTGPRFLAAAYPQ